MGAAGRGNGTRYRIVVGSVLSDRLARAFAGLEVERGTAETAIIGEVADQAGLFGLLQQIRDLGLELVSVEETR